MSDIAQLGIQINSQPVTAATTALTGLAGAAKQAGPAVVALNAAAGPANAALGAMAVASAHASAAHAGFSTQAMAATHATRSMIEGFALGMPPMQIMMQQIAHLSYAASGPGGLSGAFKEAGGALVGFLTPARVAAAGVVGVVAGLAVGFTKLAESQIQLDDISERTGSSLQRLNALQNAAGQKGIGTAEFNKSMTDFAKLSTEAQHSIGGLFELFQANGGAVGSFDQNLATAANILARMPNDAERSRAIQALGLPATREWVQLLGQGGAQLNAAANGAQQLNSATDEQFVQRVREMNDAWNTFTTNLSTASKSIFVTLADQFERLDSKFGDFSRNITRNARNAVGLGGSTFGGFQSPVGEAFGLNYQSGNASALAAAMKAKVAQLNGLPTPAPAQNVADLQKQIALEQQRIGILGQTASVEQQVRSVELQIQAARLNGVNISAKEAEVLKSNARDRALGIEQGQATVDSLRTEAGAFGMLSGDAAAYTFVQNRLNQAKRDGQVLTLADRAALDQEGEAIRQATQHVDDLRLASDTLGLAFNTFHTQIQNGATTFNSFRLAGLAALNSLESKLIDIAAKNLVNSLFGNMSGGIFSSLFGGVHHGGSGPGDAISMRAVSPATFIGAPRFHSGVGPNEVPAIIRDDESVLTPGQMRALGNAMGRGGGSVTIAPTINVGSAPGDDGQARKFAAMIASSVQRVALDTIRDQKRPGGILA